MILGIEALNPHQRANTRDPSINKMIYYRIERGGVISSPLNSIEDLFAETSGPLPQPLYRGARGYGFYHRFGGWKAVSAFIIICSAHVHWFVLQLKLMGIQFIIVFMMR
jgi:hypothetical protein